MTCSMCADTHYLTRYPNLIPCPHCTDPEPKEETPNAQT